jgi:hypothetical protein
MMALADDALGQALKAERAENAQAIIAKAEIVGQQFKND